MGLSRIDVFVAIVFSAIAVGIPTVIVLRHFFGVDLLDWLPMPGKGVVGVVFLLLSLLVCTLNFFLAFVGPYMHERKHGSLNDYHSPSGLPVIGGVLIVAAAALAPPSTALGVLLLSLYAIDGYGLPWVLVSVLRNAR